jgi:hypothetical protein
LEVEMAITRQSDRRKSNRRENNRRKGDTRIIKIEEEGGKEQERTVRHEAVPKRKQGQYGADMKNLHGNGAKLL